MSSSPEGFRHKHAIHHVRDATHDPARRILST
jgi:hypothetical protein